MTKQRLAHRLGQRITDAISRPDRELNRWVRFAGFQIRLGYICLRQLRRDRFNHVAAGLAFRTIFGLVPLLVLVGFTAQFFVEQERATDAVQQFLYTQFNVQDITFETPRGPMNMHDVLGRFVERIYDRMRNRGVGMTGLLVLAYAAIALLNHIERAFNAIYQVSSGRSLWRRLTTFWTALTLMPLLLAVAMLVGGRIRGALAIGEGAAWWAWLTSYAWSLLATWLVLMLIYVLLPNTRVTWRAAAVGALTAAVPWVIAKGGFALYVQHAVVARTLYGAIGGLLLFFLWIHISWIIVLFGLEMSYVTQNLAGLELEELSRRRRGGLMLGRTWLFRVAAGFAESFHRGEGPQPASRWADAFRLPADAVAAMADLLVERGVLTRINASAGPPRYLLNRPPERIALTELAQAAEALDVGRVRPADQDRPVERLVAELSRSRDATLGGRTLAELVSPDGAS